MAKHLRSLLHYLPHAIIGILIIGIFTAVAIEESNPQQQPSLTVVATPPSLECWVGDYSSVLFDVILPDDPVIQKEFEDGGLEIQWTPSQLWEGSFSASGNYTIEANAKLVRVKDATVVAEGIGSAVVIVKPGCSNCHHDSHLPNICSENGCSCGKCQTCDHQDHYPNICPDINCPCGKCPDCHHAVHFPFYCEENGCSCPPPESCPWCPHLAHEAEFGFPCSDVNCICPNFPPEICANCSHSIHLPDACSVSDCDCGKNLPPELCRDCGHTAHLPDPCIASSDCGCGHIPPPPEYCLDCGHAVHLPEFCTEEGCNCGKPPPDLCFSCSHNSHLPGICQEEGCSCGKCLFCGHKEHPSILCSEPDCLCGKCSNCQHLAHLPSSCTEIGCTCPPPPGSCNYCGHTYHGAELGLSCPEIGCTCPPTPTSCPVCNHSLHLPEDCSVTGCNCHSEPAPIPPAPPLPVAGVNSSLAWKNVGSSSPYIYWGMSSDWLDRNVLLRVKNGESLKFDLCSRCVPEVKVAGRIVYIPQYTVEVQYNDTNNNATWRVANINIDYDFKVTCGFSNNNNTNIVLPPGNAEQSGNFYTCERRVFKPRIPGYWRVMVKKVEFYPCLQTQNNILYTNSSIIIDDLGSNPRVMNKVTSCTIDIEVLDGETGRYVGELEEDIPGVFYVNDCKTYVKLNFYPLDYNWPENPNFKLSVIGNGNAYAYEEYRYGISLSQKSWSAIPGMKILKIDPASNEYSVVVKFSLRLYNQEFLYDTAKLTKDELDVVVNKFFDSRNNNNELANEDEIGVYIPLNCGFEKGGKTIVDYNYSVSNIDVNKDPELIPVDIIWLRSGRRINNGNDPIYKYIAITIANDSLRLWKYDNYSKKIVLLDKNIKHKYFEIPNAPDSCYPFYIEGLVNDNVDTNWYLAKDINKHNNDLKDSFRINISSFDVEVDSDNNDYFNIPNKTTIEDIEEEETPSCDHPGKLIQVDDLDKDMDNGTLGPGIPGFADGFDWDKSSIKDNNNNNNNMPEKFVPLVIKNSSFPNGMKIKIDYSASYPKSENIKAANNYNYPLFGINDNNYLRLWTKDASSERKPWDVSSAGDFIQSKDENGKYIYYSPSMLKFINGKSVLYIEAVKASKQSGDNKIKVSFGFPCSNGGFIEVAKDEVNITAVSIYANPIEEMPEFNNMLFNCNDNIKSDDCVFNPCCLIRYVPGSIKNPARFKVEVYPKDLSQKVEWTSNTKEVVFYDPITNYKTAKGSQVDVYAKKTYNNSSFNLSFNIMNIFEKDKLPYFKGIIREKSINPAMISFYHVYPINMTIRESSITAEQKIKTDLLIKRLNSLFSQVGLRFEKKGDFAINGLQEVDSFEDKISLTSKKINTNSLEVYIVNELEDATVVANYIGEHCSILVRPSQDGLIIENENAPVRYVAHEIGHACGLDDIYIEALGNSKFISSPFNQNWLSDNKDRSWDGAVGGLYSDNNKNKAVVFHHEVVGRLLMYGTTSNIGSDIPAGNIRGDSSLYQILPFPFIEEPPYIKVGYEDMSFRINSR